jgi:hypothetical protein
MISTNTTRDVARLLLIGSLILGVSPALSEGRALRGTIVGFDCGESPFLIIQEDGTGTKITGACYEEWCEMAAREPRWCQGSDSDTKISEKFLGRRIGAEVSIENLEEPTEGVLVNQFDKIIFID